MGEATGKVYPVHVNKFKFGIKGLDSKEADMVMPKDLENFAPSIDGTTEEWYAMDAGGWAKASMTGKKLGFSFKAKRSVGDPGNDYIAGLAWKFGQDVMTKFEWIMVSGAKMSCDVVVSVTTPGGGDTTNIDTLEFEVTSYGAPVFTAAPADGTGTAPSPGAGGTEGTSPGTSSPASTTTTQPKEGAASGK